MPRPSPRTPCWKGTHEGSRAQTYWSKHWSATAPLSQVSRTSEPWGSVPQAAKDTSHACLLSLLLTHSPTLHGSPPPPLLPPSPPPLLLPPSSPQPTSVRVPVGPIEIALASADYAQLGRRFGRKCIAAKSVEGSTGAPRHFANEQRSSCRTMTLDRRVKSPVA